MHDGTKQFIQNWCDENIQPEGYEPEGGSSRSRKLAERLRSDANAAGIPNSALDAAVHDMIGGGSGLAVFIAGRLNAATNAEVQRLADKDD